MVVLLDVTIVQHRIYVRAVASCLAIKATHVSIQHSKSLASRISRVSSKFTIKNSAACETDAATACATALYVAFYD